MSVLSFLGVTETMENLDMVMQPHKNHLNKFLDHLLAKLLCKYLLDIVILQLLQRMVNYLHGAKVICDQNQMFDIKKLQICTKRVFCSKYAMGLKISRITIQRDVI